MYYLLFKLSERNIDNYTSLHAHKLEYKASYYFDGGLIALKLFTTARLTNLLGAYVMVGTR